MIARWIVSQSKLVRYALLIALSMVFSYIEMLIPMPIPIPGIKIGLANLVIVVALYMLGDFDAMIISLTRILLVGITFGNLSMMLYSLAGGLLSIVLMIVAKKTKLLSIVGVSIIGGVFHNIGQILLATTVIENIKMLYYLPILLVAGAITGLVIGIVSKSVLDKIGDIY